MAMQQYREQPITVPVNHSNLFNAMIYPFTRMVIYGSIWYQGITLMHDESMKQMIVIVLK